MLVQEVAKMVPVTPKQNVQIVEEPKMEPVPMDMEYVAQVSCVSISDELQLRLGLELNWNSFEIRSIRFEKFTIRLIQKGKKSSKNLKIFNSKFVRFEGK